MSIPTDRTSGKIKYTPSASNSVVVGTDTAGNAGEFWVMTNATTHQFTVFMNVPVDLQQQLLQLDGKALDAAIQIQLAAYPRRLATG